MRQQTTTTLVTYSILLFAGAVPLAMPSQLTPASASGASDREHPQSPIAAQACPIALAAPAPSIEPHAQAQPTSEILPD